MSQARASPKKNILNFTLAGLDELKLFPTPEARQKALDQVGSETRGRDLAVGIVIVAAATIIVLLSVRFVVRNYLVGRIPYAILDAIPTLAAIATFLITLRVLHRWGTAKDLRHKLLACGIPVCLRCGYDLRGLPATTTTCPECGRELSDEATKLLSAPASSVSLR